jgi:hypothetical protein
MKRHELEHVIRAAASISGDSEIVVIGSQAILGQFPDAPPEMCVSNEADVYPLNQPDRWELIDGSIGELSPFHETFGYYAQGVQEGTAILPDGWKARLVSVRSAGTAGATGLCLEVHDLVISKYVAGRDKDRRFVQFAAKHGLVSQATLIERLALTPVPASDKARICELIRYDFAAWAPVGR